MIKKLILLILTPAILVGCINSQIVIGLGDKSLSDEDKVIKVKE
jgi:hypothetical protein